MFFKSGEGVFIVNWNRVTLDSFFVTVYIGEQPLDVRSVCDRSPSVFVSHNYF